VSIEEILQAVESRRITPQEALRRMRAARDQTAAPVADSRGAQGRLPLEQVRRVLIDTLAKALFKDPGDIKLDQPYVDMGLDSIIGVEWMKDINRHFHLDLPTTTIYDHPTIDQLVEYIASEECAGAGAVAAAPERTPAVQRAAVASAAVSVAADVGQALVIGGVRTLDEVVLADWDPGQPSSGEIAIRVKASAINFPDVMCVNGLYPTMPAYPFVPGFEVAGVVVALGAGVSRFKIGDEVVALTGEALGGHAARVNVPEGNAARKPAHVSFAEACSLPVAFSIVHHAFSVGDLRAGEQVLVQTATGACGLVALQMARLRGAVCIGTSSREHKRDLLRRLHVEHALDYRGPFDEAVRSLTGGRGVDVVLNMLSGEAIQRGLDCLAPSGRYLEIAVHGLRTSPKLSLAHLLQNQSIHSMDLRSLQFATGRSGADYLAEMVRLLDEGKLQPIVSRIYPVGQTREALEFVGRAQHIGKVVLSREHTQMVDLTETCIRRMLAQERRAREDGSERDGGRTDMAATPPAARAQSASHAAIAVIGMAGQFPMADSVDQFWENVAGGRDCVTQVSPDRWSADEFYSPDPLAPGKTHCKWLGQLADADKFDPLFFSISPAEAEAMDPQQRLVLQNSWACIEDAGLDPAGLSGAACGVFIGAAPGDYGTVSDESGLNPHAMMGQSQSILAARISFFLNLKGPCITLDTACSSALVAVAEACNHLRLGQCRLALAGGVNVMASPQLHIMMGKAGMLSANGRCRTFDDRADGLVPAESVGLVLLKRLDDAVADGDAISAVIRGWGVNQDGKTNGITAPSAASQAQLQAGVYEAFGIDPSTLTLVEAHGTGTKLGDPIEVRALTEAFRKFTPRKAYCALGSVKSNIGHAMAAAGIAGFIKVVLALRNRQLPPTLHFEQLNGHVQLEDSPFYISTTRAAWQVETGARRRAAVSSFGFSGTNAHVVVEEAPASAAIEPDALPVYPLALSARTPDQLGAQVARLLAHLERHALLRIGDLSYTLACGRKHFGHRLITVAASTDELRANLQRWLRGESVGQVLVSLQANGDHTDSTIEAGGSAEPSMARSLGDCVRLAEKHRAGATTPEDMREYRERLWELARGYVNGKPIAFGRLLDRRRYRPLSLPTYPFARERYWLQAPTASNKPGQTRPQAMQPLHPLLQQNTSDLEQQRFSSTCTGEEFYLADHVFEGHRVLPGVAYLEMAREAVMRSAPAVADATVTLRNVVWLRPLVVDGPRGVHIELAHADDGDIDFDVYSTDVAAGAPDKERLLHAQGRASLVMDAAVAESLDLASLRQRCDRPVDAADCYAAFSAAGLTYGPAHRGLTALRAGRDAHGRPMVVAEVELPSVVSDSADRFVLHPAIVDCALQASIAWDLANATHGTTAGAVRPALPFALEKLDVCSRTPTAATVVIRQASGPSRKEVRKLDVHICDASGRVCVRLLGFSSRSPNEEGAHPSAAGRLGATLAPEVLLCKPVWTAIGAREELAPAATVARCVLLGPSYAEVASELERRSSSVQWAALIDRDRRASEPSGPGVAAQLGAELFARLRGLLQAKPQSPVLIQVVLDATSEGRACALALSALLRTAQQENSRLLGQVIELSGAASGSEILAAVEDNARVPGAQHIRCAAGVREVAALHELDTDSDGGVHPWADSGVYLITGGAGGLGSIIAHEILVRTRNARVILTGRSAPGEAIQRRLRSLEQVGGGARTEYRVLDVADAEATAEAVRSIVAQHGSLNGIVHAAGATHDNFIHKKSTEEFAAGLVAKLQGTLNLDLASRDCALDFFILFSSVAGVFGNPGQADYALANGFMDGFAACRNEWLAQGQRRGRSLSVNWPMWADGGMQVDAAVLEQARRRGVEMLATSDGIDALYRGWRSGESQVVVLCGDRSKLAASLGWTSPAAPSVQGVEASAPVPAQGEVDAGILHSRVQRVLVAQISVQLKVKEDDVDVNAELSEFGFDSISLTAFGNALNQAYGLELAPTIFFEYPTVRTFAEYLAREHRDLLADKLGLRATGAVGGQAPPARSPAPVPQPPGAPRRRARATAGRASPGEGPGVASDPVAIVGMSGVFPGAADLDEFWENLRRGETSITEIPPSRWDWRSIYGDPAREPGKTNIKWGGFIEGVDEFDPLFFNISPLEAVSMDPQHRLLMTHVWRAIEDAGYAPQGLSGSRTAVFVGTGSSGYRELLAQVGTAAEGYNATSGVPSIGPNRVSFLLNLHGPSEPIETACSSSLVAIHRSVRAIQAGDCEQAIAGGVNTIIVPWVHIAFGQAGMLCPDGRCKAFSKDANGYVRGEGVGMLFLKKLSCAERDGDHIHGLIRASRENHGGRANSLTAPNPKAQAELIKAAFQEAGIDPRRVSYIETHGTGTQLGDPIEINGLKLAFADLYAQGGGAGPGEARCGLGSVKSNIGHLELAAGVAGVIKVLLQMRHRTLVKTLHCDEINPYIDFSGSPFYLVRETQPWEAPRAPDGQPLPRMAGVSSFGFGGVNAHVIIEEYVAPAHAADAWQAPPRPALIVLSARTEDRLREQARQLLAHVQRRAYADDQLASIAYTLQVGRDAMDARLAFTARSIDELQRRLADCIEGRSEPHAECYRGEARKNRDALSAFSSDDDAAGLLRLWLSKHKHAKLLELWVKGLSIDWSLLYEGGRHPARLSLPAYPFARERYWIGEAHPAPRAPVAASPAAPAPAPQWLEVAEQWRVAPQPWAARSVRDALGRRGSPRVLILHRDAELAAALSAALARTRVGDASMIVERIELPSDPLVSDRLLSVPLRTQALPDVVFYLGDPVADVQAFGQSELPRLLQVGKALMAAAGSQALQFFYCCLRSESSVAVFQEGLSGLFRAMVMECPRHVYRSIEYSGTRRDEDFAAVVQEWLGSPVDAPVPSQLPMVRLRDGLRQVTSLVRAPMGGPATAATPLRHGATYLMAGALGEVGQAVCHELARKYAARLVIFSRRARDTDTQRILTSLTADGATVFYRSVDLTDRVGLAEALASVKAEVGPLDGVFHFARAVSDGPLLSKDPEAFRRTVAAKVSGTVNLDELTAQEPLDFFVAFSSMAAFGIAGSADYGYASAFQNALMRDRHRRQLAHARSGRSLALCWGQWRADAYSNQQRDAVLASMGFDFIDAPAALAKLEEALGTTATHEVLGLIAVRDERQVSRLYGLDTADDDPLRSGQHRSAAVTGELSVEALVALNDELKGDEEAIKAELMSRSYEQLVELDRSLAA
jgi:polyketide synthase PksN